MRRTVSERFESFVSKDERSGCWLWTGCKTGAGYGQLRVDGKVVYAHRLAWQFYKGAIPDGLLVLHRCDVPSCCNPAHLFLGTHADNMADKITKGRQPRGECSHLAKISEAAARAVMASAGTQSAIASKFGISQQQVSKIKRGERWAHLRTAA